MLSKLILLFICVGQILADTPFIKKGERAELFEILDNEVPIFRITVPEEDIVNFKKAMEAAPLGVDHMLDNIENGGGDYGASTEFDTIKNATMVVEINGTEQSFEKVSFSLGGSSARSYGRLGFNLKIRDKKKDLYGRTQFRFRSDARDATYLRSKLSCDMHNRLGLKSLSAGYAILYVNEEYFGFYVLLDSPKLPWIEQVYGEKDAKNLYKCKLGGMFLTEQSNGYTCENENDEVTDRTEWLEFLRALDNSKSIADVEDILDVDKFLYESAFDYLAGSWDHFFHSGHNYSMYKQKNGKWTIIYYDFDGDIGQDVIGIEFAQMFTNPNKDYPTYTVEEWFTVPIHIVDVTIFSEPERFNNILKKFVEEAFNPAILFPRIDELKEFIRPYIVHDRTPDENGYHPGVLNLLNPTDYSIEQWEANSEFTTINDEYVESSAYGLKYWILQRYRTVCKNYNMECDPVYMDEDYEYAVDKELEGEIDTHKWDGLDFSKLFGDFDMENMGGFTPADDVPEPVNPPVDVPEPVNPPSDVPEPVNPPSDVPEPVNPPVDVPEPVNPPSDVPEPVNPPAGNETINCLAELLGYPCCEEGNTDVYDQNADGEWGYDFYEDKWCGLTPYDGRKDDEECWSEKYGYPCCKGCTIELSDKKGKWGYEENWCGIQSYCK